MQVIENSIVKEKMYIEKLDNGLTVIIFPKKNIQKKYVIWGTNFGSIDNTFIIPGDTKITHIPDGVAHFLEHKMFEQKNGVNSLDALTALGVDANAYTTNDHTAYLFEGTDNFYLALDEFMDYVQNPYFTDENVEKEKGIIAQEIKMYDDHPAWQLYLNTLKCLYNENPIKIDIAGTVESINKITKEILYNCYNTFYNPSNMTLVVCGDFEPKDILKEIKKRLINKEKHGEIKRIYPVESLEIAKKEERVKMEVSNPMFMIGYKDNPNIKNQDIVKKHIAIEIVLQMLLGPSSKLFKELEENGIILGSIDEEYEFSKQYAHVIISGNSRNPDIAIKKITEEIEKTKKEGLNKQDFNRIKKKIYGGFISEYNDVSDISRMILSDYFKGINSFDYIENYNQVTIEYAMQILNDIFVEDKKVISIVESNN